jgi:hypothetical protein
MQLTVVASHARQTELYVSFSKNRAFLKVRICLHGGCEEKKIKEERKKEKRKKKKKLNSTQICSCHAIMLQFPPSC